MDRVRELFTKNRNGKVVALLFILVGSFLHFKPDPWRNNTSTAVGVLTSKPIHHLGSGTRRSANSYYKFSYSYVVNDVRYSGNGRKNTNPESFPFTVYYQTNNPSESRLRESDDAEIFDGLLVAIGIMILFVLFTNKSVPKSL